MPQAAGAGCRAWAGTTGTSQELSPSQGKTFWDDRKGRRRAAFSSLNPVGMLLYAQKRLGKGNALFHSRWAHATPRLFFFFLFYNFILTGLLTTKDCSRPWSCLDLSLTWEFLAGQDPARSLDTAGERSVFVARIHAMTESL